MGRCKLFLVHPSMVVGISSFAPQIQYQHLLYTNILTGDGDSTRKPSIVELRRVLDSLLASHAVLFEDSNGHSRKSENERRILLNIEQGEVERVLGHLGGQRWKNALGV